MAPRRALSPSRGPKAAKYIPNEFIRFLLSGTIGTALSFATYQLLLVVIPFQMYIATTAWVLSYLISIVWQHALHGYLVFERRGPYWKSLIGTYVAYSLSIVLSSVFTWILETIGLGPQLAYAGSVSATGVLNYYTVKQAF